MARVAKRVDLRPGSARLEPTFSLREVGDFLGIKATAMVDLVSFGRKYGAKLHPTRGGLWPTFIGAQKRRVTVSAIERHLRHMARLNGEVPPPPIIVIHGEDARTKSLAFQEVPS